MKENSIEEDILNIEKYIELVTEKNYCECNELNEICLGGQGYGSRNVAYSMKRILSDYKRVLKENEELKEYIAIAPNLDEMTAIKYRNIQQDAYIQGRAEEQQKAKQIIYENYIPIQKVKDKIEEYKNMLKTCNKAKDIDRIKAINERILELQELIEGEK